MIMRNLACLSVLFLTASGCKDPAPVAKKVIRPVRYIKVLSTGSGRARKFAGTSQAGMSSVLSFKVAGTLQALKVKAGDRVDKGQVIAKLDSADHELRAQQARAALQQVRAQARNAKASYDRVRALYENSNASKSNLDGARAQYETAKAQGFAASKSLELAQRQLSYCVLKSPSSGVIDTVMGEVGENVNPGSPVANLSAGDRPEVRVEIPEILISQVQVGANVSVRFDAVPDAKFDARVSEVGVAPQGGATTFPVTVKLLEADARIRPRLAAEVQIIFVAHSNVERFIVPAVSVGADSSGNFVFTVTASAEGMGIVSKKMVEVGELTSEGLDVIKGLTDGELLVTAGVSRLTDGQTVRLPKVRE